MTNDSIPNILTNPGAFVVGCNYWASHAGTHMWRDWRPEVVDEDLRRLSEAGLQVLRVFPVWADLQPIADIRGVQGRHMEYRHGELPLPDDDCGRAGMSAEMLDRFASFLDMAEKHHLGCIVGMLTGFMSGRLFIPPALEHTNPLTDPAAIQWELRYIRHFVTTFKHHPAVLGWDLGNECNCMARAEREQAFTWTAAVANAIRAVDQSRPVVSGMHGLLPTGNWLIQDQAELTDLLTTHPYPEFTPHCDQDPVNTIRTTLHSTAESRMYADIGGKPCLCQETGTLGPMNGSDEIAADFARTCLFSLWANDCHGMLWWCANDQAELCHAPYDWSACERELGLLRLDGTCKPVLEELGAFRQFLESLPFSRLPLRKREAVCILTSGQDNWGVAYSSYVLAKQAGLDIEFQYSSQPMKDAPLYLLPSLSGHQMIPKHRLDDLLARVREGAALYMSLGSGLPSQFEEITGLEPQTRERRGEFGAITLPGLPGAPTIPCCGDFKIRYKPTRATVLGAEPDGNPALSVSQYGKGRVIFLSVPLEQALSNMPGAFHSDQALPCWQVYRYIAQDYLARRVVTKSHPMLAVTEHELGDESRIIVLINHSPEQLQDSLTLRSGWAMSKMLRGEANGTTGSIEVRVEKNNGAVMLVRRT